MPLTEKDRKQLLGLLLALAILAPAGFWYVWYQDKSTQAGEMQVKIDSLQAKVDSAKKDLARGSVEALRRRVAEYEASARLMRRLVPEGSEVPNLIDDVSSR